MGDLPLGRITDLVPEFAVKDLPLDRKLTKMINYVRGRRVIGICGSLIWSKTLMELIFNPLWWISVKPEGPVSQIHSPHLLVGAPGIFSDLLRSVQMLERERESGVQKATGSYLTYSIPSKTAALVPEFAMEHLLSAELQPWFLHLQWKTCPWAEHSEDELC